jgi:hypothetical protein
MIDVLAGFDSRFLASLSGTKLLKREQLISAALAGSALVAKVLSLLLVEDLER